MEIITDAVIEDIEKMLLDHANYIVDAPKDSRREYWAQWKDTVQGLEKIICKYRPDYSMAKFYSNNGWGILKEAMR